MSIIRAALIFVLIVGISSTVLASDILQTSGVQGGLVVHIGCGDAAETIAMGTDDGYLVQGLETDPAKVVAARENIKAAGVYGKVTADRFDGKSLPYLDNLVNLIVADADTTVSREEIIRVLAPRGVALIGDEKIVKPVPDTIDDWTHSLYDPQNNAVSDDQQVGPPEGLQWACGPRWSRHHEHMSSVSAMVSAKGRLFYIMDEGSRASIQLPAKWKLIARDAFSGVILWKRDIPTWWTHLYPLKSGPAILSRRLIAIDDRVYVALGVDQPLVELDAVTGRTLRTYEGTGNAEEVIYQDGMLLVVSDMTPHEKDTFVWTDPVCWTVGNDISSKRQWGDSKRSIFAIEAETGKVLWAKQTNISPSTLSANDRHVVYFDGQKLVCINRFSGRKIWTSEEISKATKTYPSYMMPNLVLNEDVILLAPDNKIIAFSLANGKKLWERPKLRGGHRSPDDLMCIDDLVWTADVARTNRIVGYDLHTGEEKRNFKCDTPGYWFHHRCHRSKATTKYLMPSRTGIEYVDWDAEHWDRNHWVRGACVLGVIPANGLTYAPQHPCACYLETKLTGLNALTASTASQANMSISEGERLEPGPAYSTGTGAAGSTTDADWPTYRGDNQRSGHVMADIGEQIETVWSRKLGGKLSAITAAGGLAFVSTIDEHTIYALDQNNGSIAWHFIAGGRVDSPPTIYRGRVYFGCNDGYVYCLRMSDGELVWLYLAARGRCKHVAMEQVESVWPVSGSVLIREGVVNCIAGRSAFLDGGMRFCRIDAASGKLLSETIIDDKVPGTDEALDDRMAGLNMPPALPDVLSCDDNYIYMRSQEFTFDGVRTNIQADSDPTLQIGDNRHLFSSAGYLDDSWFHRIYWEYGGTVTSGCNFWFFSGRYAPAGRIMCFDDENIYSFGRLPKYYMWTPALEYRLYAAKKEVTQDMIDRVKAGLQKLKQKDGRWIFNREVSATISDREGSVADVIWSQPMPKIQARAMALTGSQLLVAGPPDMLDEEQAVVSHWEPDMSEVIAEQDAALLGRRGAMLWVVSTENGRRTDEIKLDSPPVWDGMAAARGRVFISTMDGAVHCFKSKDEE